MLMEKYIDDTQLLYIPYHKRNISSAKLQHQIIVINKNDASHQELHSQRIRLYSLYVWDVPYFLSFRFSKYYFRTSSLRTYNIISNRRITRTTTIQLENKNMNWIVSLCSYCKASEETKKPFADHGACQW